MSTTTKECKQDSIEILEKRVADLEWERNLYRRWWEIVSKADSDILLASYRDVSLEELKEYIHLRHLKCCEDKVNQLS